ncbi:MAG: flagellar motor switch phosphatase FliY [Spirochaetales bacterium]|nr:flagellar motor switch phosphatase FliY [Spirochaetales bacterium]
MSDGALSQDEIDALLKGTDDSSFDMSHLEEPNIPVTGNGDGGNGGSSGSFSAAELSLLKNMIVESSSGIEDVLSSSVPDKKITINNPRVEAEAAKTIGDGFPGQIVEVKMDYEEGVIGEHFYFLNVDIAKELSELMMGQRGGELTDASLSAVSEAMNVISGNVSNKIGTKIGKNLKPAPPQTAVKDNNSISLNPFQEYLKVSYDFTIEGSPTSVLTEIYDINIAREFLNAIQPVSNAPQGNNSMGMNAGMVNSNQGMMNMGNSAMMGGGFSPAQQVPVRGVQFSDFSGMSPNNDLGENSNIKLLMDVNMELTVELGRTKKSIKDILGMGEGTVIELDKLAGEPVDVLVNGQLIAKGEVVVIDENFGVRVTEIVDPMERLRELT